MMLIIIIITLFYCILIGCFILGFDKVEEFDEQDLTEETKFSILIPFRNEAENLSELLQSLDNLDYPKILFEIILVDDASEDNSVEIINNFKIQNHTLNIEIITNKRGSNSPKKDAITTAVKNAKYEWIITTDADCIVPIMWLKTLDSFIKTNNPKMIVAPVTYSINKTFFQNFQLLDFLSLQSATIAGFGIKNPFLCNGANFAYKKSLFNVLNGFEGNTNISSGDDLFLLEKALQTYPKDVMYLKSLKALVVTKPQATVTDLIQQRLRWAAKTTSYNNTFGKFVGLIVLLMNALIISVSLLVITSILRFEFLILIFTLKFFFDILLIHKSARFFNQTFLFKFYILSSFIYPFFSVYIAVYSVFFGFKWKSRAFKK
ncbi:glycosyltransferase [Olleya sp. AH-315-F22]|nr:glycosyltransferase [Olleya sp. AH-315-F22]